MWHLHTLHICKYMHILHILHICIYLHIFAYMHISIYDQSGCNGFCGYRQITNHFVSARLHTNRNLLLVFTTIYFFTTRFFHNQIFFITTRFFHNQVFSQLIFYNLIFLTTRFFSQPYFFSQPDCFSQLDFFRTSFF